MNTIEVVAAVIEKNGKFLIAQRPEHAHLGSQWEFPGGKIEPGETHEQALVREIKEELSINICPGNLIGDIIHNSPERCVHLYFYKAVYEDGEIVLTEHQKILWCSVTSLLKKPLASGDMTFVMQFLAN
ncbi:NUDIX hydrolase [Denitrovibrio acetiphilus DSM 12809]|uniref:NUDIX hydrolase n=1 Tax=Denitrovibrio acetiphilus (strain DSM 12809 / NBRC 114555 / N2460) TaxID=522772 RepID=D4H6J1_DENA2|nr:NUDIX hydrolase [Denitrovibrio acetiphilus DSM 12809]